MLRLDNKITKSILFACFMESTAVVVNDKYAWINAIEREDGSNKSYNVLLSDGRKLYIRFNDVNTTRVTIHK